MMCRNGLAIKAATILALAMMPAQLLAKPRWHAPAVTRKVVLMDFAGPSEAIVAASRETQIPRDVYRSANRGGPWRQK